MYTRTRQINYKEEQDRNRQDGKDDSAGGGELPASHPAKFQTVRSLLWHIENKLAGSDNWEETKEK